MTLWRLHQLMIVGLVLAAFLLGSFVSDWVGMAGLALMALLVLWSTPWRRPDLPPRPVRLGEAVTGLAATGLVAAGAAHAGWGFDLAGWVLALLLAAVALVVGLFGAVIRERTGGRGR